MADLFYVGAYWGPRSESAGECAGRLARCLTEMGVAHPALTTWFRKGSRRSAATKAPVPVSSDALMTLLAGGRNRTDIGGEVISELGFNVALWNGNDVPVSFSTTCGASPATSNVQNYFTLELPEPAGAALSLYDAKTARAIFGAVVESWQPRWATFASYSMRATQGGHAHRPVAGWMTYLQETPRSSLRAGSGVSLEELPRGALLVAGPDPLHVSDRSLSAVADFVS